MRAAGYSLIELLVVISIISIMAVVGFVNFKDFSSDQVTAAAVGQIQSFLRLAQSNATSSTVCGSQGAASWSVIFNSGNVGLACGSTNSIQKTYTLENAQIASIIGSDCGNSSVIPLTIAYSSGVGALTFSSSSSGVSRACLTSASWTIMVRNLVDTNKTRSFKLSKGGAIDVR